MRTIALLIVLLQATTVARAAEHAEDAGLYQPDKIKSVDGPKSIPAGAKLAALEGDPTKDGPFVMHLHSHRRCGIENDLWRYSAGAHHESNLHPAHF